jgi:hypothetical protein
MDDGLCGGQEAGCVGGVFGWTPWVFLRDEGVIGRMLKGDRTGMYSSKEKKRGRINEEAGL